MTSLKTTLLKTTSNSDLTVTNGNKPNWNNPENRRQGFHNLHRNNRYGLMMRSDIVLDLEENYDPRIEKIQEVVEFQKNPAFSAMVVLKEQDILHETYAADFDRAQPHSMQSITKLFVNLIVGELWEKGVFDLDKTVGEYLPEIGSGYANARIQDVLDMNIENSYSEDYDDPYASSYDHEATLGWRLETNQSESQPQLEFLKSITSNDLTNESGHVNYKSANTDVLGCVIERISGKSLRTWVLEIVEAIGLKGAFHCSTDRFGLPVVDGGGSLTARDLGRFGLLFTRHGMGANGKQVGSAEFIESTVSRATLCFDSPRDNIKYSNQAFTNNVWIGHSGYGGQFMLANLKTGIVGVFFSVLENASAYDPKYTTDMISMLEKVSLTVG